MLDNPWMKTEAPIFSRSALAGPRVAKACLYGLPRSALSPSALCSVSINRVDGGLPLEFTPLDPPSLYWLRHRSALRSSPCIRPPPRCTVYSPRDRLLRSTPRGPLTRVYPRTPTQGISAPIGDPRGQWLPGRVCRRLSWAERLTVFPSGLKKVG